MVIIGDCFTGKGLLLSPYYGAFPKSKPRIRVK